MRILVTGHRGQVGAPVAAKLAGLGHDVAGFDWADGQDILDLGQVQRAAAGCAAVVHLAALAHDTAGRPEQIMPFRWPAITGWCCAPPISWPASPAWRWPPGSPRTCR